MPLKTLEAVETAQVAVEKAIETLLNYIPSENQEEALEKVREIMQSKTQ